MLREELGLSESSSKLQEAVTVSPPTNTAEELWTEIRSRQNLHLTGW